MRMIQSTLLAEGPNDAALTVHLTWLLTHHFPKDEVQETAFVASKELEGIPKGDLARRMRIATENHPCDILFVHRDADSTDAQPRHDEIDHAAKVLQRDLAHVVAVVPIQTLEAWLLFDADALFRAVGKTPQKHFNLPALKTIEQQAQPKALLHDCLRLAHGGTGRKRDSFKPHQSRYYLAIANAIADTATAFEPLLDTRNNVTAFQRLSQSIVRLRF